MSKKHVLHQPLSPLMAMIFGIALSASPVMAEEPIHLEPVKVEESLDKEGNPPVYAGGQVARGAKTGILGNTDIMDSPFSTTSYTAELMENQQARTLADVLDNDPSVRFTTSAGHMYENYSIRGFDLNAGDLALNGMYGLAPYGHVAPEFLERVEVLKGPSALLNGMSPNGAVGGSINLVPKRADDKPLFRVTTDYTSESQFGGHLDMGRRFGANKQFGIRFNTALRDGATDIDDQSKTRKLAALGLDYRGSRLKLSLDAYANEERITGGTSNMASFTTTVPRPPDASTNQFRGIKGRLENQAVVGRAEYEINDYLSAYAGLGSLRYRYDGFINSTHTRSVNASGDYTGFTTNQRGYTDSLSAEAGLRGTLQTWGVGHQLVLGGTFLDLENGSVFKQGTAAANTTYPSNIYNPATPILAGDPGPARKSGETTLASIALADTLSFAGDKVLLTLGARYQQVQTKSFNTTTGAQTADYDKGALTPAVGIVIKPWTAPVSLFANYIQGLSKGDMVSDTLATNYRETFEPYKSEQIEFGAKWDMGRLVNTLSFFQITKPTMLKNGPATAPTYVADGEQRNRGIEWNVSGEVVKNVRLLGGATYMHAVLTQTANGTLDGKKAFGTPEWQFNIGGEWDLPWINGATLEARTVYTGTQYVNSTNTQSIPSWIRQDLGARYATKLYEKDVVFRANVNNVLDDSYWAGGFADGFVTLGGPRTIMLSATVDF